MPLRTRLKRAFTRHSHDTVKDPLKDPNIYYQPGEKMPPMKYRRPVDPEHKKNLEAFSWAKAWRRRSDYSQYSPMGTRNPSRKSSYTTMGRKSIGGRSVRSMRSMKSVRRKSTASRIEGTDSGFGGSLDDDRPHVLREWSDEEGDVLNVGLSRNPTQDPRKDPDYQRATSRGRRSGSFHAPRDRRSPSIKSGSSRPATADRLNADLLSVDMARERSRSASKHDIPFSPEDLELALKKSHLDTTKEESDRSGSRTPMDLILAVEA